MRRILLFSFLLIILCGSVAAQNNIHFLSAATRLKNKEKLTRTERYLSTLDPDTPIEGSMYLEDEFIPAVVIYQNGNVDNQYFFRYNAFYDEMEFIDAKGDTLVLENPAEIRWVIIGSRKFVYDNFQDKDDKKQGFLEVIADGDIRLLCRHTMVFERADPPYTALHHGYEYDRFRHFTSFYLQQSSTPTQKIKLSLADLMKTLPERKEKIEYLWKKLKPNTHNLSEIKNLFRQINLT
ncbi:MAG: hypothetical protein ACP5O2_00020 [Bacteroidales bacterium]